MQDNVVITHSHEPWIEDQEVEVVERKGLGHPDSLCDGISEAISLAYSHWCQDNLDIILHHNFDKVQIVAGEVQVTFGHGAMVRPLRVQIGGRATILTPDGQRIPLQMIALQATRDYLRGHMRHLDPDVHCLLDCFAGASDAGLAHLVQQTTANDTSFGAAHWPLSRLERLVYETARYLNETLIDQFPIGEDVKVMGLRQKDQFRLTCATAFLAPQVPSVTRYRELKAELCAAIETHAAQVTGAPVYAVVNAADDLASGHAFLTLTGTSAEGGDDGATGRGNRITGLITPCRHSSLEAVAGKNPISHVGKLYNVLALHAAQRLVQQLPDVCEAQVLLLSQIGRPVNQPQIAHAAVQLQQTQLTAGLRRDIAAILRDELQQIDAMRQAIVAGEMPLF